MELFRVEQAVHHARAAGFREGVNVLSFPVPDDRYAGQLHELARIVRGEMPNDPAQYDHDLKVHELTLKACGADVKLGTAVGTYLAEMHK